MTPGYGTPQVSTHVHADHATLTQLDDVFPGRCVTARALHLSPVMTTTMQQPYEGAEVLVFTRGNRGYMCRIQTVWANGYVTLIPCSHTIPSLTVWAASVKYGTKINVLGSSLGKIVFSYRPPIKVGDTVRVKRGMVGEGYRFVVARVDWSDFEGQNVVAGANYGPRRASELEVV